MHNLFNAANSLLATAISIPGTGSGEGAVTGMDAVTLPDMVPYLNTAAKVAGGLLTAGAIIVGLFFIWKLVRKSTNKVG